MRIALSLWLFALLCEVGMLDVFAYVVDAGHGGPRLMDEVAEMSWTFFGLALGGPLALLASALAIASWLRRCRPWIGIPCSALLGLPLLLVSSLGTHVLLAVTNAW